MPIVTLTYEKIQELNSLRDHKLQEKETLQKKKAKDLWLEDLDVLDEALTERLKLRQKEEREERARIEKSMASAGSKHRRRAEAEHKEKQRETKRAASAPALGRIKKSKTA